jgi:hypothetical protein
VYVNEKQMTPEEAIAFNTTLREGQTLGILEKPTSVVPTRNDCQNGGVLTCHSRKECNVPSREGPLGPACPVCPKPPTCLEELRVSNERVTELGEALVTVTALLVECEEELATYKT